MEEEGAVYSSERKGGRRLMEEKKGKKGEDSKRTYRPISYPSGTIVCPSSTSSSFETLYVRIPRTNIS